MININELRVGNILSYFANPKPGIVNEIRRNKVYFTLVNPPHPSWEGKKLMRIEDLNPIPITTPLLIRNGFQKSVRNGSIYKFGHFEIRNLDGKMLNNWVVNKFDSTQQAFDSVHELQNIYHALIGIELPISKP